MATARKMPSGNYKVRIYDYTDQEGKKHYKAFTAKDKKTTEKLALDYSKEKRDIQNDNLEMTLYDAIEKYINSSDGVLSPTTINGYKTIQKSAFKSIMHTKLKKISNEILKCAVNEESKRKSDSRRCKGQIISPKTVANEYGLITAVLNEYTNVDCKVKLPAK